MDRVWWWWWSVGLSLCLYSTCIVLPVWMNIDRYIIECPLQLMEAGRQAGRQAGQSCPGRGLIAEWV